MLTTVIFDRHKLHMVPPILLDFVAQLQNPNNTPEVRENYAQRFEVIRDYCDYALGIHDQLKRQEREQHKQKKRG